MISPGSKSTFDRPEPQWQGYQKDPHPSAISRANHEDPQLNGEGYFGLSFMDDAGVFFWGSGWGKGAGKM